MTHNHVIEKCKQLCRECAETCQEALFQHCLQKGGEHADI